MKKSLLCLGLSLNVFASTAINPNSNNMSESEYLYQRTQELYKTNAKGDILEAFQFGGEPTNWFNLSPISDEVQGVATEAAYKKFGQPKNEVIVAVIDSGVDVNHEDLQGKVWINNDEIPNNGIDDDNNGYIDDVFGWNFIGGKKGMAQIKMNSKLANKMELIKGNPQYQTDADTLEMTREVLRLEKLKKELNSIGYYLSKKENENLNVYKMKVARNYGSAKARFDKIAEVKNTFEKSTEILKTIGLEEVTIQNIMNLQTQSTEQEDAKSDLITILEMGYDAEVIAEEYRNLFGRMTHYDLSSTARETIVGDNQEDVNERVYGNNDIIGPDSSHGTHVAGTIAANRDNTIGMKGVAANAKIMAIRCVPNGDERDKDVANSIRYAVDNGAKIINMSFGKSYSPNKKTVDEAVKYAHENGVIIVHAAGNEYQNTDLKKKFPNKYLTDGSKASNWMEVGASTFKKGRGLPASFSNYGNTVVDLFAPGRNVYSTFPNNTYKSISGTSMATPVVSGVLALTLGYKDLSPELLRDISMGTVTRYPGMLVYKGGLGEVLFSKLSVTGGVINVYNMLEELNL